MRVEKRLQQRLQQHQCLTNRSLKICFDEAQEITFDNNSQLNKSKQMVPPDVQTSINNIVNTNQSDVAKNETKEMIKGGVLGAVIGSNIVSLQR